ncbi:Beta-lactamase-like protein [Cordyceps fumosorosea ARSEF 2679]|uniref:Beta-lactamase-like protein n=1 Tax=Cordyceps fumosorosea (strain ARSEF 2679) TaxID=1081104 RepID=A0A167KSQ1_CORFA|nr:Beta-lactamase-like protein [Cordyceps fumosorosea ARSEF 2679]OAA52137.1 Beta-lactamase-like protein [Cordyceps fumosorosea ARSEF 2679]
MTSPSEPQDPTTTDQWLVCTACGTQFPTSDRAALTSCFICDDPRQFVPASGQSFTTTAQLKASRYQNTFTPYARDPRITYIRTEPSFGIGQRATLIATPAGNVLWDCLTLLDDAAVSRIRDLGGLAAIVISHPHFYSAHVVWARAFACPVYLASEDAPAWCAVRSPAHQQLLTAPETSILPGVTAVKVGGHFPGSLVLLFERHLFVADTFMLTLSGVGDYGGRERPQGLNTFSFMWSYPNMIPLGADELAGMWERVRGCEFEAAHGSFVGRDLEDSAVKARLLESMQLQVRAMGHSAHPLLEEVL